jgi:hypothetical protein
LGTLLANYYASALNFDARHDDGDVVGDRHGDRGGNDNNITVDEILAQVVLLQRMVPHWFMKPFEAQEGGAIDVGCANEKRVIGQLNSFLQRKAQTPYQILQLREYGLLANRSVQFAFTSPDAVCALGKNGEFFGLCAVEIKTHSSLDTINVLNARIFEYGIFQECAAGSPEFQSFVPNAEYRTQIVHHATVLGVERCCIAFTTASDIMQIIIVSVSTEQRAIWLRLFKLLCEAHMSFVYGPSSPTSPPRIGPDDSDVYGYAREHHSLDTYVHLWHQHNEARFEG